jgi:outer membrane immunogenic protein
MKAAVVATLALFAVGAAAERATAADLPPQSGGAYKAPPPVAFAPAFSWTGFYIGVNGGVQIDADNTDIIFGLIGGTAGYNYQVGPAVLGVETDIAFAFDVSQNSNVLAEQTYFGTLRGRLGYAWDRFMPFVSGGLAYSDININNINVNNDIQFGYTIGGGIEAQVFDNWTAKLEYNFVSFDDVNGTGVQVNQNVVRGGLNLKF